MEAQVARANREAEERIISGEFSVEAHGKQWRQAHASRALEHSVHAGRRSRSEGYMERV